MRYVIVPPRLIRWGLPIHVNICDTKTKEHLATAYGIDSGAKIVSALNEYAEKEGETNERV